MPLDRTTLIAESSTFYRNNFRLLMVIVFILIGIAYCLLGFIIYQEIIRPTPKYFITTSSGQLNEITPLQ